MKLKRTFHAVGQGAFYTERFYDDNGNNPFNVVYDCGTSNSQQKLVNEIQTEFAQGTKIDYLFISHFHHDHFNGIKELRSYCHIVNFVIPVISPQMLAEATLYNYLWLTSMGYKDSGARFEELIDTIRMIVESEVTGITEPQMLQTNIVTPQGDRWVYIPYNPSHNPVCDIIARLRNHKLADLAEAYEKNDFERMKVEIKKADISDLKLAYEDAFKNHHCYVMPVYSGYENPIIKTDDRVCLYTGDYDASDLAKVDALRKPISRKWDEVGTLQVPHHGSLHNSCKDLYLDKDRNYVISSFGPSRYHHPHGETLEYICEGKCAKLWLIGTKDSARFSYNL